jgi:hypothetical protein
MGASAMARIERARVIIEDTERDPRFESSASAGAQRRRARSARDTVDQP